MNINNYLKIVKDNIIIWIYSFHDDFAESALLEAYAAQRIMGGKVVVFRTPPGVPEFSDIECVIPCVDHKWKLTDGRLLCCLCHCTPYEPGEAPKHGRRVIESS